MAADIQTYLNKILNTVYGRDVRSAIHDAIELCYNDVSSGKTIAENAAAEVNDAKEAATNAANAANAAASDASIAATDASNAASDANSAASSANSAASTANAAAADANSATVAANRAVTDAQTAVTEANKALDSANEALEIIEAIDIDADEAAQVVSAARTATEAANTATTNANLAAGAANSAASNADSKAADANSAASSCTTAITAANLATTNANNAKDAANTAANNANNARDSAVTATTNANNAATAANTAATNANTAITNANAKIAAMDSKMFDAEAATNAANTATSNANAAASSANTAAETINGLTVDYEDVGPSTPASVILETIDGHKNLHFLLRQGRSGASFIIKGNAYDTLAELQADITDPEEGDQYNVGTSIPYHVYRWTGTAWEDQGTIGSESEPITAQDVQAIQNGREIEGASIKVMKVEALNYLINTLLVDLLSKKVDTVSGKGLSTNDYTNDEKSALANAVSAVSDLSNTKVDKIPGKGLSSNDFTNAMANRVALIGTDDLTTVAETIVGAINELVSTKASLTSPAFTGTPTSVTPVSSDDSNKIATTSFVKANISSLSNIYTTNVVVSNWSDQGSGATYSDYPFRASVAISGVTSSMFSMVAFSPAQVLSENYAPVCETYDGGVYVYSKVGDTITIPTIAVFR